MSGFGVLVKRGGRPHPDRVRMLAEGIAPRGPTGVRIVDRGECVLVHAQFATTPEAERESQPLRHVSRDWWLTADARIDNRDELRTLLESRVEHPLDTDADFLMAAFELWGTDLARHLRGDFAFAIWNGESRDVLLARDHLGLRPLHWARPSDDVFVAGSALRSVLEAGDLPRVPDLHYLAEYATFRMESKGHSPIQGIHRLIPAHSLVARTNASIEQHRYWSPNLVKRKIPIEEAAEHLKQLFDDAVRVRSRRVGPLGVQLSGGYDSSAVFLTAVELQGPDDVIGLALQFPGEGCDETEYIAAVAESTPAHVEWFNALNCPPYDHEKRQAETLDLTVPPDNEWFSPLLRRAASMGCRVVLTGQGGDHVLHGSPVNGAIDLLRQWRPMAAVRMQKIESGSASTAVLALARQFSRTSVATTLTAVAPVIGTRLLQRIRRARQSEELALLGRELLVEYQRGRPTLVDRRGAWAFATNSRANNYRGWDWFTWSADIWDQTSLDSSVEHRHPFLDVRIIDYVLSLGEDLLLADGRVRGLHVRAIGSTLPEKVRSRRDKAEFGRPWVASMLRAFPARGSSQPLEGAASLIQHSALEKRLRQERSWLDGGDPRRSALGMPSSWSAWGALSTDEWLKALAMR